MRAAGTTLAILATLAACAPVSTGSVSEPARNSCTGTPDCAAYQQTGGSLKCGDAAVCQARDAVDLTLVVTLPDGGVYAPGQTFITKYADLVPRSCGKSICLTLPSLGEFAGLYSSTITVAQEVGFYLGVGRAIRSLPTLPTFRRTWTFVDRAQPVDVELLGMPLQPLVAPPVFDDEPAYPAASLAQPGVPVRSIGFDVLLPAGQYEETLAPAWPFAAAFPPVVRQGAAPKPAPLAKSDASDFQNAALGDTGGLNPSAHPVIVTRGGGLSLEGWTLLLRDAHTRRPISSTPRLTTADVVTLFTINQTAPGDTDPGATIRDGVDLVLRAPAGEIPRPPELVLPALANRVPPVAPYPLLPFQAIADGVVLADNGLGLETNVVFISKEITMLDSELSPTDLSFVDQFTTAADGTFSRTLPPGRYHAVLTPPLDSGLAKTVLDVDVATPTGAGQHQALSAMRLIRQDLLRGIVRTTDGRLVEDAEVEAQAAALLPYDASKDVREPLRWPRTVRTRTIASGEFVLPVDPGGTFDLVVRPAPHTAFPWVIKQGVTTSMTNLIVDVPAPVVVSATLLDPNNGAPAGQALVQAFIGAPSTTPGPACAADNDAQRPRDGMCPPTTPRCTSGHCVAVVALEIGRARTDDSGRFTLFLDGRPR